MTGETLSLHGNVYGTLQLALETERQEHPDDRALHLAAHRLTQAQRRLTQRHEIMLGANPPPRKCRRPWLRSIPIYA